MSMLASNLRLLRDAFGSKSGRPDDDAIAKLLQAVNETKRMLAVRQGGEHERSSDAHLVDVWTNAAIALRKSNPELARRLQQKAEYWAAPSRWTEHDVHHARIGIDEIAATARLLLGK